jgi:hypothetical protein
MLPRQPMHKLSVVLPLWALGQSMQIRFQPPRRHRIRRISRRPAPWTTDLLRTKDICPTTQARRIATSRPQVQAVQSGRCRSVHCREVLEWKQRCPIALSGWWVSRTTIAPAAVEWQRRP